jgi:hypothetical protein
MMSKAEILSELPKLTADELAGEAWLDGDELAPDERTALDVTLAAYHRDPNSGSSWQEVRARIEAKLRQ